MLLVNQLDYILGQVSKVKILRFLAKADVELNGREIAAAVGLSHVKTHAALKELYRHGVVIMRCEGRSILYRLNRDNLLVKRLLKPLFEKEAHLGEIVAEVILKNIKPPAPKSIVLFGSFATGVAKPDSDIDVLIIPSQKKKIDILNKELEEIEDAIVKKLGNRMSPIVIKEEEFKTRFRENDELIRAIANYGKVIFGASITDLIKYDD